MKKSYADICIERAGKATPGPWKNDCGNGEVETENWRVSIASRAGNYDRKLETEDMYARDENKILPEEVEELLKYDNEDDMYFIAAARADVPELARRLKRACENITITAQMVFKQDYVMLALHLNQLVNELEAPLGDK